jgi:hypothetical protein
MKTMTNTKSSEDGDAPARAPDMAGPVERYREHDLLIRRFHIAGLVPGEIAVVLNSKGLRVRTWAVSETFVRARLDTMGLVAHHSRTVFHQSAGAYRLRPEFRKREF